MSGENKTDLPQTPRQEFATGADEKNESFEKKYNEKRSKLLMKDLASLVWNFEEKRISLETVKYVAQRISMELLSMGQSPKPDNYTLRAFKELESFLKDIQPEKDKKVIAQKIKDAITFLEQIK